MYRLSIEEMMLCAKIFAYAMGDRSISMTQLEKDEALALLKRMTDQRWDWTEQQKTQFKTWIDLCKLTGRE